jgi:hypothetical protein
MDGGSLFRELNSGLQASNVRTNESTRLRRYIRTIPTTSRTVKPLLAPAGYTVKMRVAYVSQAQRRGRHVHVNTHVAEQRVATSVLVVHDASTRVSPVASSLLHCAVHPRVDSWLVG